MADFIKDITENYDISYTELLECLTGYSDDDNQSVFVSYTLDKQVRDFLKGKGILGDGQMPF